MRLVLVVVFLNQLLGGLAAVASEAAVKPQSCSYAPVIVDAADFVLTEPLIRPPIWRDRLGDDAAYWKIRYGGLDYDAGAALLRQLQARKQPPERLPELRFAHARDNDRAQLFRDLQSSLKPAHALMAIGVSGWRAQVTRGDPGWLFDEMATQNSDQKGSAIASMSRSLAAALADLDDRAKIALAKQADAAGLQVFGVELLETAQDLRHLVAFLDHKGISGQQRESAINAALNYSEYRPKFDISTLPPEASALYVRRSARLSAIRPVMQLLAVAPEAAMLMMLFNQTGNDRLGWAAHVLFTEVSNGDLDPTTDRFVVRMVELMDLAIGRTDRQRQLAGVTVFGPGQQKEEANVVADKAFARLALGPLLNDSSLATPPRPDAMTGDFPWDLWTAVADDLQAGRTVKAENRIVGADLLIAAGREADAIALLRLDASAKAAQRAHALIWSLDRRCANLLGHPVPLSEHFYRFDDN